MLWFLLILPSVYGLCNTGQYNLTDIQEGKTLHGCYDCPSGYAAPRRDMYQCIECNPATYQDLETQSECKTCPDGWSQPVRGAETCLECAPARFVAPSSTCVDTCPDGSWPEGVTCEVCEAGRYSVGNSNQCYLCEAGLFKKDSGPENCTTCPIGFVSTPLRTSCSLCDPGTQSDEDTCRDCSAGKYENNYICTDCAPGKISSEKQSECTPCESGKSQSQAGSTVCESCLAGQFATTGQRKCTSCPLGYGNNAIGSDSCAVCVGSQTIQGRCEDCEAGLYQHGHRCAGCPLGYASADGATTCEHCATGRYSDDGILSDVGTCKVCTIGSVNVRDGPGSWKCCLSGCSDCPAGKYRESEACNNCPEGYFSLVSSDRCTQCSARQGEYQDQSGASSCKECLEGQDSTGTQCIDCGPGTSEFMFDCVHCPRGWYSSEVRNPDCVRCDAQFTTASSRSTSVADCSEGCAENHVVDTFGRCQVCGGGKYVDGYVCSECPLGYYKETPTELACTACPAGFNVERTGQLNCFLCPPGETCGCPWGQYGARDSCADCPAGYFSKGNAECTACSENTYQDEEGKGACKSCPAGTFNDVSGQAACTDCPSGQFQMFVAAGACEDCPIGRYSGSGQVECTTCSAGKSTAHEGASSFQACSDCAAGKIETNHVCVNCNEGLYQNDTGAVVCKSCPTETWSSPGTVLESECFRISGLVTYTFGNVQDSKKATPFETNCELRPNFVMLCPACTCDADSRNGFWGGPMCDECQRGFATRFCTSICPGYDGLHDSTICNGNGKCWFGRQGNGMCYCGGKDVIDPSADSVYVDVRYCPAGQICPGYGVEKVPVMTYIPLYYLINYRQYTSFVLQMSRYTPERGHMWFKRFSPSKGFENTCTQCTSKFTDSTITSIGFWNNQNAYELFPSAAQSRNGFHGENCQYECAVCLNGGKCVHSPHPYRYSYTIKDTFLEQKSVIVPTTACLCSANVFDASHMCCPNGFQPYVYYGKRGTTPYTRYTTVPYITSVDNRVDLGYYADQDLYLEPGIVTPYAEPEDGRITISSGRARDFGSFRELGPYNKHVYHGTTKEICRACPGLFGKGVRAVNDLIETEQQAENYWWNFPASAGSKKCKGQGVCDFYAQTDQINVDFMGDVNDWALLYRGTLCKLSIEGFVGYDGDTPITSLETCVAYGLSKGAQFVGWAPTFYTGGTDDEMLQSVDGPTNYMSADSAATSARSSFATAWARKGANLYTVVEGELPIPDTDSEYLVYPLIQKRCIAYRQCTDVRSHLNATQYRAFNVYTIERGRGDERLDTATFDRFDTCFTYTKNYDHDDTKSNERQKFGLYLTQNYEQGDDPFLGGLCPRGYFCTQNSKGVGFKEACPIGYYQPLEGQTRTLRDIHCSRLKRNSTGCQPNVATKTPTDYVDSVCLRCPRDSFSAKGAYECTPCPPGRVKKVSGDFDPNAVDVYNIPTMATPYWWYIQNEGGTLSDDCAIVPPSIIHVPTANDKMVETVQQDQFLPVVSCPFGYSSQPGSYIIEDIWNMQSIMKTDTNVMEAPYILIDGDIQIVVSHVPCDCLVGDEETSFHVPVSKQLCLSYSESLSSLGVIRGIVDGTWYGCIKNPHSQWLEYSDDDRLDFNYPNDVQFICQRVVQEETLMEEFVSTYCYECPGDAMTGPGSGICTTCTANLIKKNMKLGLQKLVMNSEARMYHCDNTGGPIPRGTEVKDPKECAFRLVEIEEPLEISVDGTTNQCDAGLGCSVHGQQCTSYYTVTEEVVTPLNDTHNDIVVRQIQVENITKCCTTLPGGNAVDWKWTKPEFGTFFAATDFCSNEEVACEQLCAQDNSASQVNLNTGYCNCVQGQQIVKDCKLPVPEPDDATLRPNMQTGMSLIVNDPNCKVSGADGACQVRACPTITLPTNDTRYDIEYEKRLLAWYYVQQEDRIWPAQHVFGFITEPAMDGANIELTIDDCVLACSTVFDKTYDYKTEVKRTRVGYARNTEDRSFCLCNEGNPDREQDAIGVAPDTDGNEQGSYCYELQQQNQNSLVSGSCTSFADLKVTWYESVIVDDWAQTEFPLCGLCSPGKKYTGSACVDCAMGQFTADMQQSMKDNCQLCPAGFFQDATGSSGCRECKPGLYVATVGTPACKECVPGQHQDEYKMTACKNCPAGYQQDDGRAVVCKICPVGRFEPSTKNDTHVNDEACTRCPTGRYEDELGSALCKQCAPGRFQNVESQTSCQECAFGKFMADEGQPDACDDCPRGFHQDQRGQSDCKTCVGNDADDRCEVGGDCQWKPSGQNARSKSSGDAKYADRDGMKNCQDCPQGTSCQVDAAPVPCATGSAMPPGWYSKECYECNGAYYANGDKAACEVCNVPSNIDATRSACTDCLAKEGKRPGAEGCGVSPFDVGCDECVQCAVDEKVVDHKCEPCCQADATECATPRRDPQDGTQCTDCENNKFWNGEECLACPGDGWKQIDTDCDSCGPNGWRLHWYKDVRRGSTEGTFSQTKTSIEYTGPFQTCCWDADDYTSHQAWVVTGKNTGSVTVHWRTDDWLKLYVKNLDNSNVYRDWKTYGLDQGGTTSLPANSVFHVKFQWSSNDGVAKFKITLSNAEAFNSPITAGNGGQIYRKC